MAYNKLSTANLPDPVIDPAQGSSPEDYFGAVVWAGNGSATKRTDIQFDGVQPDLVWLKNRTLTRDHALHDDVRGLNARIKSNNTEAESTSDAPFDTDGFGFNGVDTQLRIATTNSSYNASGSSYVAWGWKASGASGVSNNVGSIPSTVSANTTSGFAVVSWSGNQTSGADIGHGLDSAPELIITKCRTHATSWVVGIGGISGFGVNDYLILQTTNAKASSSTFYQAYDTDTFTVGVSAADEMNKTGRDYISYVFHSVEGFSKFGSYIGNGSSTDSPFVYLGFRPAWVLIKQSSGAGTAWNLWDSKRDGYNLNNWQLEADDSKVENTSIQRMTFLSNGFKIHQTGSAQVNASGQTYIYMAFAENPFKYSNAR